MHKKLLMVAAAIALMIGTSVPAGAGPVATAKVTDFYTNALDADGCFRLVHCAFAHQAIKDTRVKEVYHCEFVDDPFWGTPTLPEKTMEWNYDNTRTLENETCDVVMPGPYRWVSEVEDILSPDACQMYTNAEGEDIGDSSFRMVIRPSGNVNVTVVYDPPVFEGPGCSE